VSEFIERDVDGCTETRDESQGVTAGFVNIDEDDGTVWWETFEKVRRLRGSKKIRVPSAARTAVHLRTDSLK